MKTTQKNTNTQFEFVTNWHGSYIGTQNQSTSEELERMLKREDAIYEGLMKLSKFVLIGLSIGIIYLILA